MPEAEFRVVRFRLVVMAMVVVAVMGERRARNGKRERQDANGRQQCSSHTADLLGVRHPGALVRWIGL
jgi:hypothetical protein